MGIPFLTRSDQPMPTQTGTNDKTTPKPVKRRNRLATMERILRATGELMSDVGTAQSGINGVAQRAGVNKVLIYRYFGGWNGLVEAFVQRGFFLTIISERGIDAIPTPTSPTDRLRHWQHILRGILAELRTRPAARALLRWELANGQTELANRLASLGIMHSKTL